MKNLTLTLSLLFVFKIAFSQFISYGELKEMLEGNTIRNKDCFVILKTGDTINGDKLHIFTKNEYKMFNGYSWVYSVKINKEKYNGDEIVAYQNSDGYVVLNEKKESCGRISTGKINVYVYQHFSSKENPTYKTYEKGVTKTYFVFQVGEELPAKLIPITSINLRNAISSNSKALAVFEKNYPKPNDVELNDYEKFLEVIRVYNKN